MPSVTGTNGTVRIRTGGRSCRKLQGTVFIVRSLTWVRGQLWCVLSGGKLNVFDLTDPTHPRIVVVSDRYDLDRDLAAGRDFVAANSEDGVWVFQGGPLVPEPRRGSGRSSP